MPEINDILGKESLLAIKDYVDNKSNLIETTWSVLKGLRDNFQLIPGRFYRITDYTCTTITTDTSSAEHVFDIVVRAYSVNKLNEEASAIQHNGDTYFANNNLSAWKLWYSLDNDTTRFGWADSTNGKGVIYRMIDEFENDCPYDFKNILFTSSGKYTNAYTFSYTENNTIKDASILGIGTIGDYHLSCYNNAMKEYTAPSTSQQRLNFNVFYSIDSSFNCYDNTFEKDCHHNIFEDGCYHIILGDSCDSNTFGEGCYYNTFGKNCHHNTFENGCHTNTFKNNCHTNTFGPNCYYNTFEDYCYYNTFGNYCYSNTFGNYCYYSTFGNVCNNNIIGNTCKYIVFGTRSGSTNTPENNYRYNIIDNGCQYITINGTPSSSNYLQYIHIHLGVKGKSSSYKTITVDRDLSYETNIVVAGTTTIEV